MIHKLTRTILRTLALALGLGLVPTVWAAPYVMSNADGSAYHWDGGYNWDSGAASPNEISFTLSNPSGVWANGTFPNSGKVALTCISISGRKDGSNADIHHIVLQETGGNSYTSSSVEVLDGASNTENCFVTTLAGGDSDHTYNAAGTYGQGAGQKTVNVYFDNVAVDVTKALTLTTYTAATTKGKLGTSVVTSPKTDSSNWKAAMRVYGTYYYDTDTSVSALNTIIDAASDSEVVFALADGVKIDIDDAFSTASHTVKIVSAGSITLSAASQPATTHFTNVDFSGVKGGVLRSWLTPGVVGYNFKSNSGSDTSVALVSGGTWLPASTADQASGSTTAMFADGLSTFTWSSANTWAYSSGTILNGYLDDPSPQASVSLSNVPYEAYDLIVYVGTDTNNSKFRPVTVNGTSYTWDSSSGQTTTGSGSWGLSQQLVADYGINALRINNLSGPLAIKGGSNSGGRGCIAAIQIMPVGTLDSDYVLTLDGTATSWSTGTWTFNGETVSAPTVAHSVEIVASASTTLTIDTAATVGHLIINGTGDATVTISKGSAALTTKQVTVESGILKHGSDNSPLGSPSLIVVNDGGAMDLGTAPSSGYYTKIAGQGVLKDGVYTGALFSSANITGGSAQLCGITLTANATIRCDKDWGIIRSGWNPGTLNLGSYTLTKVGSENFWICNVTDSASGNIVVSEGRFTTIKNKSTFSNATLTIGAGATLRMDTSDGGGATDLEVKNLICDAGSTVNIAAARTLTVTTALTANGTMNPLGTVTCNGNVTVGGDVVVPSDKTWTVTGMLTVADGGKLEIKNNALVPGTLALSDGGTLKIANVSDAAHKVTAGTVTFPASGLATIDVSDIPEVEEDGEVEVLAGSTSLPADVSTLRIVGKKYSLESESNALKVVNDGGLTWNSTDGWTKDVSKYGDATITSPGTVALGGTSLSFNSVTLSGSGTVSFSATGSETVSIKNLEIGAGVTLTANAALDLTGCTITGDGTLDIPVGTTYAMDGVTSSAKVTVEGTLETSGTTTLSGANTSAAGSLIEVVSDTTTLSSAFQGIGGNITIDAGAALTLGASLNGSKVDQLYNHINPNGSTILDISGTLNVGVYMLEFGSNIQVLLRTNARVTANTNVTGDNSALGYGHWAWLDSGMGLHAYGNAELALFIRTPSGVSPVFNIEEGATLVISQPFVSQTSVRDGGGSITKAGAGTLDLTAITPTKPITINAGTVVAVTAPTTAVVNEAGVLKLTNTGSYKDDRTVNLSGITGTGTIRYNGSGWRCLPNNSGNVFADTLSVELEQESGVPIVVDNTVIGSISGSKNLRSDLGSSGKTFTVKQAKDGVWSGSFHGGWDGLTKFVVQGGASSTGTLTLAGTTTADGTNNYNDELEVASSGSVNLTGLWIGDTTVDGEFGGTGSLTGDLTFNAGSTFKVWEIGGLSVTGGVTFAEGGVTVDVSDLTIGREASTVLLTATSGSNFPAVGNFTLTGSSTHVLSKTGQKELSLLPIIATYSRNDGSGIVTPYADSVDVAISALVTQKATYPNAYVTVFIGAPSYYTAELLASNGIALDAETGNYVIAEAKIDDTLYPTIEAAIANAGENDTVVLARDISRTEIAVNKEVEFSEGDCTFTGSFTGSGTLALPDGTLLKSPSSDRWASGWAGTVWIRNYTSLTGKSIQNGTTYGSTSFEPNDYGNINSTVKFTGVKGYFRANNVENYTIQPALELEDDGETPGLLLYNGWGYNSNAQCYTSIRELKGSGTLEADSTSPASSVLLQVLKWDNFTGTLTLPKKTVVFGSTLPVQTEVDGGGCVAVQSGASVEVPAGKTWTVGSGVVVYGNLSLGTGATIVNTTVANTWIKCGTGKVTLNALNDLPATPASNWAGTVVLPSFTAAGHNFNTYGRLGSKVKLSGVNGGWLVVENLTFNPEIVLAGNFSITDMSERSYTFKKISGSGNITFTPQQHEYTGLTISELASDYEGTIVNNMSNTKLAITRLDLASDPTVAKETKILSSTTADKITVQSVYYNDEQVDLSRSLSIVNKADGVYIVRAGTIFSVY